MLPPDDVIDELQSRQAAALTQSRTKVVQVEILWEARTFVLAVEQLVTEPGGLSIFWRAASFLGESVYRMRQAFDEEAGRAAASRFSEQLEAELADDDGAPPASPAAMEDAR